MYPIVEDDDNMLEDEHELRGELCDGVTMSDLHSHVSRGKSEVVSLRTFRISHAGEPRSWLWLSDPVWLSRDPDRVTQETLWLFWV